MRNHLTTLILFGLCQFVSLFGPRLSIPGLFAPTLASAQTLAKFNAAGLGISFEERGASYRVLIRPKGGIDSLDRDLTANVFAIENPSRLVIDIPGFLAAGQQKTAITNGTFSSFRLGVHQDKTRLVIDIEDNLVPDYNVTSDAELGALIVSFNFSGQVQAPADVQEPIAVRTPEVEPIAVEPMTEAQATETEVEPDLSTPPAVAVTRSTSEIITEPKFPVVPKVEVAPTPPIAVPEVEAEPMESIAAEPLVEEVPEVDVPTPSSGIGIVKGVYYQAAKNSKTSSIMVDVDGLNQYSLSQTAPGSYELLLSDTMLKGSHLSLPQFPPDTFKGFEVIVASQRGNDVVVKVYTDTDVKLSPFIAQGKLWLRVASVGGCLTGLCLRRLTQRAQRILRGRRVEFRLSSHLLLIVMQDIPDSGRPPTPDRKCLVAEDFNGNACSH